MGTSLWFCTYLDASHARVLSSSFFIIIIIILLSIFIFLFFRCPAVGLSVWHHARTCFLLTLHLLTLYRSTAATSFLSIALTRRMWVSQCIRGNFYKYTSTMNKCTAEKQNSCYVYCACMWQAVGSSTSIVRLSNSCSRVYLFHVVHDAYETFSFYFILFYFYLDLIQSHLLKRSLRMFVHNVWMLVLVSKFSPHRSLLSYVRLGVLIVLRWPNSNPEESCMSISSFFLPSFMAPDRQTTIFFILIYYLL